MSLKTNAKSVKEVLTDRLKEDSKILKETSTLLTFAVVAASGEPLSLLQGLAIVAKTVGAAISAGVEIAKRILHISDSSKSDSINKYDQFRTIFYVLCLRCYLESVSDAIKKIKKTKMDESKKVKCEKEQIKKFKEDIAKQIEAFEEAEVSYLFCIEPLNDEVPLFDALNKWFITVIRYYGFQDYNIDQLVKDCGKEARRRFHVYLSEDTQESKWMRDYLAITRRERDVTTVIDNLSSIKQALVDWTDLKTTLKKRQDEAWSSYRKALRALPDHKESMYNEQFGVRKVFLQPRSTYNIVGARGEAGFPKIVRDLGHLFGALTSTRITGEDLIILCGGPGSGKSTLCRILCSELAKDEQMYPAFLRLRRLKEGSDIAFFVEDSLQKIGVINHFADLRNLTNLILILDGFDELVMASRSRLRHFFNMLREEHSTGPLRNAKIIVSGRDTLFPQGEGLPTGSHVISLLPFDKSRVRAWGEKWCKMHKSGPGKTFKPEYLVDEKNGKASKKSPLHHLVTWPLTLHLVARVHTTGKLDVSGKQSHEIEKAYLYRSILSETASRQIEQAEGKGRLKPKEMRDFLRALAWEMYAQSTDSMDPADIVPILAKYYPHAGEADMADLADVAVVNSPELTKGEETGFEFVHKSFAEYLVAERTAHCIESVSFKTGQYGSDDLSWKMSSKEASSELASVIGLRLITEEVQEMLEPMLGCLIPFLKGDRVDQVVSDEGRRVGLIRIIDRFEELYQDLLQGKSLDIINHETHNKLLIQSPLEGYANQCAGLIMIGAAVARQLAREKIRSKSQSRFFNAEPFSGAFWRCLSILHAGGINIDNKLSTRMFKGITVGDKEGSGVGDRSIPIKLGQFTSIHGYEAQLSVASARMVESIRHFDFIISLLSLAVTGRFDQRYVEEREYRYRHAYMEREGYFERDEGFQRLMDTLLKAGLIDREFLDKSRPAHDRFEEYRHYIGESLRMQKPEEFFSGLKVVAKDMRERRPESRQEEHLFRLLADIIFPILEKTGHRMGDEPFFKKASRFFGRT